ncbi:MAG: aminotransferase class IV [Parachlamydiaceae bacterium]
MTPVFRTIKVVDGNIINWPAQLKQLEADFGKPVKIPFFTLPDSGTFRLRITLGDDALVEIEPYAPPQNIRLTLYPEPIDGPKIKTLFYRSRGFIRDYAKQMGCDDALVVCSDGYLTEASNANFFYELKGKYYTPDPDLPYLFGLTLKTLKLPFEYVKIKPQELPPGANIYLCNSLIGVMKTTYSSSS